MFHTMFWRTSILIIALQFSKCPKTTSGLVFKCVHKQLCDTCKPKMNCRWVSLEVFLIRFFNLWLIFSNPFSVSLGSSSHLLFSSSCGFCNKCSLTETISFTWSLFSLTTNNFTCLSARALNVHSRIQKLFTWILFNLMTLLTLH